MPKILSLGNEDRSHLLQPWYNKVDHFMLPRLQVAAIPGCSLSTKKAFKKKKIRKLLIYLMLRNMIKEGVCVCVITMCLTYSFNVIMKAFSRESALNLLA